MRRLHRLVPLALAGLLLLAACGDEPPGPVAAMTAAGASATAAPLVVDLRSSQFSPATVDGRVGRPIVFVNRDQVAHTATATAGARFDSGAMSPGARFSVTPHRAGVISVHCVLHPGMTGSVTVS